MFTLSGGVADDADDPNRYEVNDMILELEPRHDAETPSHTPNERTCETTPEETSRSFPPAATGNRATRDPGRQAGRPEGIHPRSTRTRSGRQCRRGCASWPGSSPGPIWSGRLTGRRMKSKPAWPWPITSVGGCVVSAVLEGETVAVAGRRAVNETANRLYPTGRRHEGAGGT